MKNNETERPIVIIVAAVANILIAIAKFIGASITGSSAMLSEGFHSLIDTGNDLLILFGKNRSKQRADLDHPMGYGRELYFWALVVAISIFGLGGGASIYEGIHHLLNPEPIVRPEVNYLILALAFLAEGISFSVAYRKFKKEFPRRSLLEGVRVSRDPSTFTILLEDFAAMVGIIIAALGVFLSDLLQMPAIDGMASILIGLVLISVAILIGKETRGLLIGEAAMPEFSEKLRKFVSAQAGISEISEIITLVIGPNAMAVSIDVRFDESLDSRGVAEVVRDVKKRVQEKFSEVSRISLEPV